MRCMARGAGAGRGVVSARALRPAMHACNPANTQSSSILGVVQTMAEWSMMDREWPPDGSYDHYSFGVNQFFQEFQEKPPPPLAEYLSPPAQQYNVMPPPHSPALSLLLSPPHQIEQHQAQQYQAQQFQEQHFQQQQLAQLHQPMQHQMHQLESPPQLPVPFTEYTPVVSRGENPREIRNKAEKQRRDKLNSSISELAAIVPPVVAANKKIDKTGVLRLTAHYLRAHQYVFGDSLGQNAQEFTPASSQALLSLLKGFLLTTTYKGLVVVVSQNIQQYLGHTELDLLGHNILNYIHQDDRQIFKDNLMPNPQLLGPNGELHIPDEPDGKQKIAMLLSQEKRRFVVRFRKHSHRSEPAVYVPCFVEGTLRKSDKACRVSSRCCQVVRRARARGENPCSSGNDVVFIGLVRPTAETLVTEKRIEAFCMEYRTRHTVDGEIMECEQRISLVAGYMTHEVNGVNAMNFIHRDDVRWVIFALREMYDQHRLIGESCYRLMAKSGHFIYMKTRGMLDVDEDSRAVRSFVCTNTVVDEEEGKYLIKQMKKRCMLKINERKHLAPSAPEIEEIKLEQYDLQKIEGELTKDETLPVQDLEKEILSLVTNLPSPQSEHSDSPNPHCGASPSLPLAIIPPNKERILSAIEKIYDVASKYNKNNMHKENEKPSAEENSPNASPSRSRSPSRARLAALHRQQLLLRQQMEGLNPPQVPINVPRTESHAASYLVVPRSNINYVVEPAYPAVSLFSATIVQTPLTSITVCPQEPEMCTIDEGVSEPMDTEEATESLCLAESSTVGPHPPCTNNGTDIGFNEQAPVTSTTSPPDDKKKSPSYLSLYDFDDLTVEVDDASLETIEPTIDCNWMTQVDK